MGKEVELVIKISEDAYCRVLKTGVISGSDTAHIGGAIIDGIELSPNHGDLKDMDAILMYKQQEVDILGKHILNEYVKTEFIKDVIAVVPSNKKE